VVPVLKKKECMKYGIRKPSSCTAGAGTTKAGVTAGAGTTGTSV
jgi:hypothetical protein